MNNFFFLKKTKFNGWCWWGLIGLTRYRYRQRDVSCRHMGYIICTQPRWCLGPVDVGFKQISDPIFFFSLYNWELWSKFIKLFDFFLDHLESEIWSVRLDWTGLDKTRKSPTYPYFLAPTRRFLWNMVYCSHWAHE